VAAAALDGARALEGDKNTGARGRWSLERERERERARDFPFRATIMDTPANNGIDPIAGDVSIGMRYLLLPSTSNFLFIQSRGTYGRTWARA